MAEEFDMWAAVATERRRLADELEQLTPEQWTTQSQCDAWNVQQAAAHVIMPFGLSTPAFMLGLIKSGFKPNNFIKKRTVELAESLSSEQIIQTLRDEADNRWTPPGPKFGVEIPLSEVVVHGQDIRNVTGLDRTVPQETIDATLAAIKDEKTRAEYARRIGA